MGASEGCARTHRVDAAVDAADGIPADSGHDGEGERDAGQDSAQDAATDATAQGIRDAVRCGDEYCTDAKPWCCPFGWDVSMVCWAHDVCAEMPSRAQFEARDCLGQAANCPAEKPYCCVWDGEQGCADHDLVGWTCVGP